MTWIPYEHNINTTNQLIYNFLDSENVSKKNKDYICTIFKNISKWNLAYILKGIEHINYPLLYSKTNYIESINRILKFLIMSRKLCNNWLYIVKKIIYYSNIKS